MRRLLLVLLLLGLPLPVLAREPCKVHIRRHERHTTTAQKREAYRRAGIAWEDRHSGKCAAGCVVDHVIPLELGGVDEVRNMQIQIAPEGKAKDRVENWLAREVCKGKMTLKEAQARIVTWRLVRVPPFPASRHRNTTHR